MDKMIMNEIIELILKCYNFENEDQVKTYLQKLRDGEEYHKRLLICLGIDTKGGNLKEANVLQVFNHLNYTKCTDLETMLNEYEDTLKELSCFLSCNSLVYKKTLTRVMRATTFSRDFYYRVDGVLNHFKDWKEVREEIERDNLEEIQMPNDSSAEDIRKLVWCTPLDELLESIENCKASSRNHANEIIDRLGLYITTAQDYIYIVYPSDFLVEIYHPNNFCNCWSWKPSLYLSSRTSDSFGRTRPRTGDAADKQMKEAVHKSINNSNEFNCSIKFLGHVTDYSNIEDSFTMDALNRYAL